VADCHAGYCLIGNLIIFPQKVVDRVQTTFLDRWQRDWKNWSNFKHPSTVGSQLSNFSTCMLTLT